jgi:uncharacterized protein (DUF885 family)
MPRPGWAVNDHDRPPPAPRNHPTTFGREPLPSAAVALARGSRLNWEAIMTRNRLSLNAFFVLLLALAGLPALGDDKKSGDDPPQPKDLVVPDLSELLALPPSSLGGVVQWYEADCGSLNRTYAIPMSPTRHARMKRFNTEWLAALQELEADQLGQEGRADYNRLKERIQRELRQLDVQAKAQAEIAPLVPFAPTIINLEEGRHRMEKMDAARVAGLLNGMKKQIEQTRKAVEAGLSSEGKAEGSEVNKILAGRAAETVTGLRTTLRNWFSFYNGYDPLFTWWMGEPYKEVDQALQGYVTFLREKVGGGKASDGTADAAPEPMQVELIAKLVEPLGKEPDVPDLRELMAFPHSEMRGVIHKYQADRASLGRLASLPVPVNVPPSPERHARVKKFYTEWLAGLQKLDFDRLSQDSRIDYLLLKNHLERELRRIDLETKAREQTARLLPFEPAILDLDATRRRKEKANPVQAAGLLDGLKKQIDQARQAVEAGLSAEHQPAANRAADGIRAARAWRTLTGLRTTLKDWYDHHDGADPTWSGSVGEPYKSVDQALEGYAAFLREKSAGAGQREESGILGQPIGREALLLELAGEMIPYTPEELTAIADQEFAWCEAEIKKASREMGFGDDWHRAVEKVKTLHVEPGKQPELIRDLALEAIDFLQQHGLVTVPPLARETWRMQMMSPQRQLINPFFTGGEVISISFPTNTMAHEAKLQSMRGNNIPFSRATVHHELIPGHHLQGYMTARYRTYRGLFTTAFWGEGWALYWEMLLYDRGFARTPEDRVGFLFWRMHRCARIIFSLNFHLRKMSPQECIDFLVRRVGHERDNATAEVRRSFTGRYGALYQAAYMLGGLQFRELRKELVDSGKMTDRAFHDAILKENRIPIAMVRASLTRQKLTRDYTPDWKFYGPHPGKKDEGSANR